MKEMSRRTVEYKLQVTGVDEDDVLNLLNSVSDRLPPDYRGRTNIISPEQYLMAVEGYRSWKGDDAKYIDSLIWLSKHLPNAIFQWCEWNNNNESDHPNYRLVFSDGQYREYHPSQFVDFVLKHNGDDFNNLLRDFVKHDDDE